ncbi:MAG: hemerythrin [Gallionellales bacterium RBG_16_56_9]|nr:MAG: hemerythrin [Gallionellales bacterium RBG_16_56_9]
MTTATTKTTVDVRNIAPRDRHPLIFGTFANLAPGEALLLVNDHDPKPLYYQFQAEYSGEFSWEYLESGPAVWKVRIGRTATCCA